MASAIPSSRRSSLDSPTSTYSPSGLTGNGSASALVLLPDSEDLNHDPYDLTSDDDAEEEHDAQVEIRKLAIPPLPSSTVFLYLLSPYLRLGALYIPDGHISLKYGLACLIISAVLSAFCLQIWYLLSRYLRKSTVEDIFLEAFARGGKKSRRRAIVRPLVASLTGLSRILLVTMYLRESVDAILPLVPDTMPLRSRALLSVLSGALFSTVSLAKTLAAKPVIFATWLSVVSYTLWLISAAYAHATGSLGLRPSWLQRGLLWNGISSNSPICVHCGSTDTLVIAASIVFAFTTMASVPLSASLTGGPAAPLATKGERIRSFQLLSSSSVVLAALLVLPLVFFSSSAKSPEASSAIHGIAISVLNASTLLLSIPSIIITTPSIPIPPVIRRYTPVYLSKLIICIVVVSLSLVPVSIAAILNDAALFLGISGTYFLPALAHITTHYFRRPLSIVVPQARHSAPNTPHSARAPLPAPSPPPSPDFLLQRKERLLQRRRLGKRIVWDIGVWAVLIPISTCAVIWAGGRVLRRW
ncbi:hypothetical protein BV22DRAFT_1117998 [Leucogyrophana mollusca]|uniref:Uncharacterized protein n=1 Tax=Leucogyrophana mollusca TaxID=85980 RepID=A0ACB8BSF0_9AGAM|nr:hypothetical protein BV22DRAFT_1117998 [Leucogyrophana mollusca]